MPSTEDNFVQQVRRYFEPLRGWKPTGVELEGDLSSGRLRVAFPERGEVVVPLGTAPFRELLSHNATLAAADAAAAHAQALAMSGGPEAFEKELEAEIERQWSWVGDRLELEGAELVAAYPDTELLVRFRPVRRRRCVFGIAHDVWPPAEADPATEAQLTILMSLVEDLDMRTSFRRRLYDEACDPDATTWLGRPPRTPGRDRA